MLIPIEQMKVTYLSTEKMSFYEIATYFHKR